MNQNSHHMARCTDTNRMQVARKSLVSLATLSVLLVGGLATLGLPRSVGKTAKVVTKSPIWLMIPCSVLLLNFPDLWVK